jgi:hypothetical protein
MKVIENYKRAVENSDENLLKEVFAPQVRVEVPAGPSVDYPVNTAAFILSQVAKAAPGIKCIWTADSGNDWHLLGFEGQLGARNFRRSIRCTSTKMAGSINSLFTCAPFRWPRGLQKSSCEDFSRQVRFR